MQKGTIVNISNLEAKGFGHIKPDTGGKPVFFHVKHKGNENVKGLTMGQRVSYTEMSNDKGVCAGNVKLIVDVLRGPFGGGARMAPRSPSPAHSDKGDKAGEICDTSNRRASEAASSAAAKGEKKKTPADVDCMVKEGRIDAETAELMKAAIKRRELAAASAAAASGEKKKKTLADVDRMVKEGRIDAETAELMKAAIKRRELAAASAAAASGEKKNTPADVDRMVKEGRIDAETAELMKAAIKLRESAAASAAAASGEKKKTLADVDHMVEQGLIDAETASLNAHWEDAESKHKAQASSQDRDKKEKKHRSDRKSRSRSRSRARAEWERVPINATIKRRESEAASSPAAAKGEKKKTPADVDRMVEEGRIDAEEAAASGEKKKTLAGGGGHDSTTHPLHIIGEYMDIVRNSTWSHSEKTSTLTPLLRQEEDGKLLECFRGQGQWHGHDGTAHFTAIPDWKWVLGKLEELSSRIQVSAGGGGHGGGGDTPLMNVKEKYNFKSVSIPVGSKVCIKSKDPIYGWGPAHPWSVGTVRSYSENVYVVEFPESSLVTNVHAKDLDISPGDDDSTKDIDPKTLDPAFDKLGFVRNKDGGLVAGKQIFEFTGQQEGHDKALWEVGFVHGRSKLSSTNPYFEVTIQQNSSDLGVGIGLSEDSFFAGSMVGWEIRTVGFHSKDGCLFYVEDTECKGIPFAPTARAGDTIGCGIIFDDVSHKPQTIFFTRNGSAVGRFPLRSMDYDMVFPVVTTASPAVVEVNLSAKPPAMAMAPACFLNTYEFEAKFRESSGNYRPVTIKGPKNLKGETPVNFNGFKNRGTVWVPRDLLRETEKQIPFSDLEKVFSIAVDGDTIQVEDCGVHLMRDPIKIRSAVSVDGVHADKRPTISRGQGLVFDVDIFADTSSERSSLKTSLKNICVKSVGGDKSKGWASGGACGVFLRKGNLTIKDCTIVSEQGTGLAVDNDSETAPWRRLAIEGGQVGPCGRHGVFLERCAEIISMKDVKITSVEKVSIGSNGGDTEILRCSIKGSKDCKSSLAVQLAGAEDKVATMTMDECNISDFNEGLQVCVDGKIKMERELKLTGCTIKNCNVAVKAKGSQAKILFDNHKTNTVKHCTKETTVENGGQIIHIPGEVVAALVPAPAVEDPTVSPVSAETTNFQSNCRDHSLLFVMYCRLLFGVGRDVLAAVFKDSYKKEKGNQWTESRGPSFLNDIDKRDLGKYPGAVDSISQGKCENWDISLLCSLLLKEPGYLKDKPDAKEAVRILRSERNYYCHSPELPYKQEIEEQEFDFKWGSIKGALDVLMDKLLPAEKEAYVSKINKIDKIAVLEEVPAHLVGIRDVILSNNKRYRLIKQVGKGGMGTVFEACLIDLESDGGRLALKYCQADQSRAEREADILKRLGTLKHDNIVRFIDSTWDLQSSNLVIIMELIKGVPLGEWLEKRYRSGVTLDDTPWQRIVKQVAEGMAAVHAENIAHRDLKPGNLIFDEVTGKLVIVDFGLSKFHNANSTTTSIKGQLGTFLWMSPEQINGDIKEISFPSDIWSIGIIWHELLTNFTPFEPSSRPPEHGRRAFSFRDQMTTVAKILEAHKGPRELPMLLSQPEKVPKAVTDTIAKCLNVNKKERFQDAKDLLNHLTRVFEELE